ncbi:SF1B family DNA helicase RecD2 [Methylobacterium radiotolerans]|uniref:SF1B family DNA helicase RecD2 n=1 Tax=Methylobacterium TaxID=407 RepID=UPI0005E616F9|nr:ATP-dependent RecD-like DNA helicase [Methylobacterium radiotolerans]MBN6821839.1 ATP-dependent RecD-like DNA helicase [Methylobacterium organophilum]OXE39430.1 ATP-dependent RecD-like DNA helicase [Methylobacterium radiotolerans]GAN50772.1 RecD/TraA family helicase [Methylobacterium sp. ME121]
MATRPFPGSAGPEIEALAGTIERVTFHSPETGFCVLKVQARGKRDLVPVIGHAPAIAAGEWITATGIWHTDRQHGVQFKADTLKVTPPTGVEGIEKYLASGHMRGIGPAMAKRIVAAFGESTFEIIEAEPQRLPEVAGIGPKRAARIIAGWAEQKAVREIMLFLHAHGVGTARAVRIFKTYGHEAIAVMTEDPYRLAKDIRGIGFKTADAIAMKLGLTPEAPQRLRAGISFALQTATDGGHCALPVAELIKLAGELLGVEATLIRSALLDVLETGEVVQDILGDKACIFLAGLHAAERMIAERLLRRTKGTPPWPEIDLARALPWVQEKTGKALSPSQSEAVRRVLGAKLAVITGGPGVGKTSTLDTILRILRAKGIQVLLAAPTGRAAKRMTEQTGLEAKTIHRLLEIDPKHGGFSRNEENPLACDLLVIDETSMVDVPLMNALTKAVPEHAALLLVGDVDQLPSVGPGQVLADVIASGAIPVARLTEVFRQAAESRIVVNAHRINAGKLPELAGRGADSDFHLIEIEEPEAAAATLIEVVTRRIPHRFGLDPVRDVQVLTPMQRGVLGARNLNHELQAVLNPNPSTSVERFGWRFSPGDRVMESQNDYDREVFNGDLGTVARIDEDEGAVIVDFEGRKVIYPYGELDTLVPAYATTIHKSQGSEYPAVVIPLAMQHWTMLARNLLYTGVTRGKRLVVLLAQRKALGIAVRGGNMRPRWTKLHEWLKATAQPQ